jgi:chorismate dehydratase
VIFGSISYLNLLPFQIFLKQHLPTNQSKHIFRYKRDIPSKINLAFKQKRINGAFISSIKSSKCRCTNVGIIADGAVRSVFIIKGKSQIDKASASSNMLAKVLKLEGKVLIGDEALKFYLSGEECIDLAQEWKDKTGLPFVFARLCYNSYGKEIEYIAKKFSKQKINIPQSILKKEAKAKGVTSKELLWYLKHIHYKIDNKADKSLKLFLKKSRTV